MAGNGRKKKVRDYQVCFFILNRSQLAGRLKRCSKYRQKPLVFSSSLGSH